LRNECCGKFLFGVAEYGILVAEMRKCSAIGQDEIRLCVSLKNNIDTTLRESLSPGQYGALTNAVSAGRRLLRAAMYPYGRFLKTPVQLWRQRSRSGRRLEIGPGPQRIPGFETVNVVWAPHVDYVADAGRRLPFEDGTFETVYASHVLEHVAWYRHSDVLREWVRILAPGGALEIWVPDGLKIARSFVQAEDNGDDAFCADGWWKFNDAHDPCVWFNGRAFSYGDGSGRVGDPNWHLALLSERHLRTLLEQAGLTSLETLTAEDVRGHDHGWINLGIRGIRP
jgi:SAM-dependent methyltransferase